MAIVDNRINLDKVTIGAGQPMGERQPEIPREIDRLNWSIDRLSDANARLAEKLGSVLRLEDRPKNCETVSEPTNTGIGSTISSLTRKIDVERSLIEEMLSLLEL